jgi:hypothetical protein
MKFNIIYYNLDNMIMIVWSLDNCIISWKLVTKSFIFISSLIVSWLQRIGTKFITQMDEWNN